MLIFVLMYSHVSRPDLRIDNLMKWLYIMRSDYINVIMRLMISREQDVSRITIVGS